MATNRRVQGLTRRRVLQAGAVSGAGLWARPARSDTKGNGKKPVKVVFLAGKPSHGRDTHAWDADARLLMHCLATSPDTRHIRAELHTGGWPKDPASLDDAASIVLLADGFAGHPLFVAPNRTKKMAALMARGVGLVCLHYAVAPLGEPGEKMLLQWIGGIYKKDYSKNPISTARVQPASPSHPLCGGWQPYTIKDELYYDIWFGRGQKNVTAIMTAGLPAKAPRPKVVAWAMERADGGRGFGFTGGHYHKNYRVAAFRTMVLNAIVWSAGQDVPAGGVRSTVPARSFLTPPAKPSRPKGLPSAQ